MVSVEEYPSSRTSSLVLLYFFTLLFDGRSINLPMLDLTASDFGDRPESG